MQTIEYVSGNINSIVLQSLASGDKYGLEICKDVEEKTNGEIVIKQPSLYSALKRLSEQELVSSYWKDSDIGGKRHYYKLTDAGKYALSDIKNAYASSRQMHKLFENTDNFDNLNKLEEKTETNDAKEEVATTAVALNETLVETESELPSLFELATQENKEEPTKKEIKDAVALSSQTINKLKDNIYMIQNNDDAKKIVEELYKTESNIKANIINNTDLINKLENIVSEDGYNYKVTAIVTNANIVPTSNNAKITIIKFDDEHNLEKRYEIDDVTNEEIEDILNQYIPNHATYSVSHEAIDNKTNARITKISIPKPDANFLTETVGNYIYSNISQFKPEEKKTISNGDDAVFLDERLDYEDVATILRKRNEELNQINFNEKYGTAANKTYEKTEKEETEEKRDAAIITNYFDPLGPYTVYSHSRYPTKTGGSKLKQNYIDFNKLNFIKHIILSSIALIEVIILSILLGSNGLIDYRTATCLFVVLYPILAFLTVSIFKYSYNKYKKKKTLIANSYFFLEVITYIAIFGIIFALNKMFGIQIFDNHLVIDALPFASWFLFPTIIFFNIVLSAALYWLLKLSNKFYPKAIK